MRRDWRRSRVRLITLTRVIGLICVLKRRPVGAGGDTGGGRFSAQLALRHKALQVRHQAQSERVLYVHAFDGHQVAGDFRRALPEADDVVIHRKSLRIEANRVDACADK